MILERFEQAGGNENLLIYLVWPKIDKLRLTLSRNLLQVSLFFFFFFFFFLVFTLWFNVHCLHFMGLYVTLIR